MKTESKKILASGMKDGIPIALGYLAVSFSLGIQAKEAGINALYASLMSILNVTSAGEFAAIGIIAANGSLSEIALSQLIINLRYMLMSCALAQRVSPEAKTSSRLFMAYGVTDEIFGISIGQKGHINPAYPIGAILIAIPAWTLGTYLGVLFGNILPAIIVNSLCIALYGMFIAIFIPPAKKEKSVAGAVILAMLTSLAFTLLPVLKEISSGTRVIIITVSLSLVFALLFPVKDEDSDTKEKGEV